MVGLGVPQKYISPKKHFNKYTKFILHLSRVTGNFPFLFINKGIRISKFWSLFSTVTAIASLFVGLYLILPGFKTPKMDRNGMDKPLARAVFLFGIFPNILSLTFGFIATLRVYPNVRQFMMKMSRADEALKAIGVNPTPRRFPTSQLFLDLVILVWLIQYMWVSNTTLVWVVRVHLAVTVIGLWARSAQFVAFSALLHDRFAYSEECMRSISSTVHYEGRVAKVVILLVGNRYLCESCEYLQRAYTFQALFLSITVFFNTISSIFRAIHTIYFVNKVKISVILISRTAIVIIFISMLFKLVAASTSLSRKVKDYNNILYKILMDNKCKEMLNNEKLTLHIYMKREIAFTACGFFNLDNTLLLSIVASTATYLIILLQFGQM